MRVAPTALRRLAWDFRAHNTIPTVVPEPRDRRRAMAAYAPASVHG